MTSPRTKPYPSQERLRELFDYDPVQGLLIRKKFNGGKKVKPLKNAWEYRQTMVDSKSYQHVRLVWIWNNGEPGMNVDIDHINRDRHDDRIENLRLATDSENSSNRGLYRNNTSGYKGVSFKQGKWVAQIMVNYTARYLGIFATKEEAVAAYQQAAAEMHGAFAGAIS